MGPGQPTATGPDAGGTNQMTELDQAITETARTYKMDFSKIDAAAYQSTLGAFNINLYVWGDARDYRGIHPETLGSNADLPVGTVIVREVLDAQGGIDKLTLMAKGPRGYDGTLGDWWFGELDAQGAPIVKEGQLRVGRLADCHGCHVPRASDDYLFGVPKANQPTH
jgi:hypothetical protein